MRHLSAAVLSGDLDGETHVTAAAAVAEHLRVCAACRAHRSQLAEARAALRSLPRRRASPVALQGRLRVALAASRAGAAQPPPAAWRSLGPSAMAGAGTWFLALLLVFLYSAPVRGFEDGGQARRRAETWQRLERYEALLSLQTGSDATLGSTSAQVKHEVSGSVRSRRR